MAAMTMEQVKAVGKQGWAIKRTILATLVIGGQAQQVKVLGELHHGGEAGALVARQDGKLAHVPVAPARLDISEDDAAHLDYIIALLTASQDCPLFRGGSTSMDHRMNWGVGGR